jgi:hypothetical protein
MSVGSISGSSPSTELQVKLVKGQEEQEEKVASTIIKSATETASLTGKGQNVNVIA